jgi:hypothetical protein
MKVKCLDVTKPCGHTVFKMLIDDTTTRYYSEELKNIVSFVDSLERKEIVFVLMYSTIKKAGAQTLAQIKAALVNQEWEF